MSIFAKVKALQAEVVELRGLIQQANSDHARERDELQRELHLLRIELAALAETHAD